MMKLLKKSMRLFGIFAIVAAIGLWAAGCGYTTEQRAGMEFMEARITGSDASNTPILSSADVNSTLYAMTYWEDESSAITVYHHYTYQWSKDGNAIPGATEIAYSPTEAGSYTVTITPDKFDEKTSAVCVVQ